MNFSLGWIKKILEKYTEPMVCKIADFVRDEWEKFKIDSDLVFCEYVSNSYKKYSKIKTVLYRTEPKYIYNFFEFPNLVKRQSEVINSKDIDNLLQISHCLIVQGTGGIGKSTFMKHLFINELSKQDLIPIYIELKDLNDIDSDYEISDLIYKKIYNMGGDFNKKYLEYALKSGCFLFLLDGFDEILTEKSNAFLRKITDFSDRYSDNYYIISSRPYSEFIEFQRFTVLSICPFDKKQAISLINKIDYDQQIKENFTKALDCELYDKHTSFASNPLLLNIMLMTYDNYAEIPEKLHVFYANAFETLYAKHDATKGGYKRELKSKLSFDAFKKVFSYFCFSTYYQGKIEFSYDELSSTLKKLKINNVSFEPVHVIYDLINSLCVLYKDGLKYKFTHRSFQEYFTAIFLLELPDCNMTKLGIELIKQDLFRTTYDMTFEMLYDMSEHRMEKNILLPILEQIEEDCDSDKYSFYYKKLNLTISFDHFTKEGNQLVMRIGAEKDIVHFACKFSWKYLLEDFVKNSEDINNAAEELLIYFVENHEYKIGDDINSIDYIDNEYVYALIERTWIGHRIRVLSSLKDLLSRKQKENDIDWAELLVC